MGLQIRWQADGSSVNPPMVAAMLEAVLEELETYVARHQNIVTPFIETGHVMDLCLSVERQPEARVY